MQLHDKQNGAVPGSKEVQNEKQISILAQELVHEDFPDEELTTVPPPDGGWGWVVVFASFMIHVIADGVAYTIGIFYVEFLTHFQSSKAATAWVASIMVGNTFLVGPFASALMNQYGCRAVAIAGALMATLGLMLSTLAPNVIFLYFSIGLCAGIGFGLMYVPAIVCVTIYFEKKRAFATGIAVCGSGFGTFAMAPLIELLVEKYSWKGAMLIVSGMVLNCVLFGALFRPLEPPKKSKTQFRMSEKCVSIASKLSRAGSETPVEMDKLIHANHDSSSNRRIYAGPRRRNDSVCSESHEPIANGDPLMHKMHNGSHPRISAASSIRPMRSSSDAAYINRPLILHKSHDSGRSHPVVTSHHDLRHVQHQVRRSSSPHRHQDGVPNGPLYRKDVFYSGSLMNIPEYKSDPIGYSASVVSLPKHSEHPGVPSGKPKILSFSEEMKDVFKQMTSTSLFKDPIFVMFLVSNFFTNIGFNVPFMYSKDRAMDMGIAEDEQASLLLSIIGIANTLGRIVLGYFSDKSWCNRLYLYNICLTLCGVATALSAFCTTYPLMGVYSAVFGVTAGAYVSLTSVILVDLLGLDKLTNAFGLLLFIEGLSCLVGPPITGLLFDYFGSYDPGFYLCGTMIALSGLMLFLIPCMKRWQENKLIRNIKKDTILVSSDEEVVTPVSV